MAITLEDPETARLAREVAQLTGESVDEAVRRALAERLERERRKAVRASMVGEFMRIDFSRREFTLRHLGTSRDVQCIYEDHVEATLLEHPREVLLVLGMITRDPEGRPISIEDVEHIEPINLAPIEVNQVAADNMKIVAKEPISAIVSFDEVEGVYQAEISGLGVSVFAESRDMLEAAVHDELALLWTQYGMSPDEKLTPAAQTLKRRVLATFAEASVAA
jgi:hypothetical protein